MDFNNLFYLAEHTNKVDTKSFHRSTHLGFFIVIFVDRGLFMRKIFQHHAFLLFFKNFHLIWKISKKSKLSRKANAEAASELSIEELEKSNLIDEPCLKDGQNFFIFFFN